MPRRIPPHRKAFTLLELLVVIGVLALLAGLLLPALSSVQTASAKARELSAARQLMMGYTAYAHDHRGAVMPGYYDQTPLLPAEDETGQSLVDDLSLPAPVAARYPWRIAPYLDHDLRGLYLDRRVADALHSDVDSPYLVSLFPSFGLNSYFVGGDSSAEGLGFNPLYQGLFGEFYVTRISQPRHPAELLVFASARSSATENYPVGNLPRIVEGYFRVTPPYLNADRLWTDRYEDDASPNDWGFVSLRDYGTSIIGFFDGHTGSLTDAEIQNMTWWADRATTPDWRLATVTP